MLIVGTDGENNASVYVLFQLGVGFWGDSWRVLDCVESVAVRALLRRATAKRRKKFWVHPLMSQRLLKGQFHKLYEDYKKFFFPLKLPISHYQKLCCQDPWRVNSPRKSDKHWPPDGCLPHAAWFFEFHCNRQPLSGHRTAPKMKHVAFKEAPWWNNHLCARFLLKQYVPSRRQRDSCGPNRSCASGLPMHRSFRSQFGIQGTPDISTLLWWLW